VPEQAALPEDLARLAAAHGVATEYRDGRRRPVRVAAEVVIRVLGLLEVDAATPADRRRELAAVAERDRLGLPPGTVAMRVGEPPKPLPGARQLIPEDVVGDPGAGAGGGVRELRDELPGDLAPGYYRVRSAVPASGRGTGTGEVESTLVVAPARLPRSTPTWGWQLQLYALHSAASWGIGDLGDLREFVEWTGREHGAGAILLNPLHAPAPTHPVQPSPYTPASRRFANPLALRVTDLEAYRLAGPDTRAEVDALRVAAPVPGTGPGSGSDEHTRIDHDLVWAAKRSALELLWRAAGRPGPSELPDGLRDFATWCALVEVHGRQAHAGPLVIAHAVQLDFARLPGIVREHVDDQLVELRSMLGGDENRKPTADHLAARLTKQHRTDVVDLANGAVGSQCCVADGGEVEELGVPVEVCLELALRRTKLLILHLELDPVDFELLQKARFGGRVLDVRLESTGGELGRLSPERRLLNRIDPSLFHGFFFDRPESTPVQSSTQRVFRLTTRGRRGPVKAPLGDSRGVLPGWILMPLCDGSRCDTGPAWPARHRRR